MWNTLPGLIAGSVLSALAMLHLYWLAGGRLALAGAIPEMNGKPVFEVGPLAVAMVAFSLSGAAALVFWLQLGQPPALAQWLNRLLAAAFLLRAIGEFRLVGFFKRVRGTTFATRDSRIYSPLCLALFLLLISRDIF